MRRLGWQRVFNALDGELMTLKSMPVVSKMARSTLVCTVVAEKVD
jgi:hypothetical protein